MIFSANILDRKYETGFKILEEQPQANLFVILLLSLLSTKFESIYLDLVLRSMIEEPGVGGRQLWGALCLELGIVSSLTTKYLFSIIWIIQIQL